MIRPRPQFVTKQLSIVADRVEQLVGTATKGCRVTVLLISPVAARIPDIPNPNPGDNDGVTTSQ